MIVVLLRLFGITKSLGIWILSCPQRSLQVFESFVKSWIDYFKTVKENFGKLTFKEVNYIKSRFSLQSVPDDKLVETLKDVPLEIVGQILDVIDNKNFLKKILDNVIKRGWRLPLPSSKSPKD